MRRKTLEEFITDAKEVHGEKYDYTMTKYRNNKDHVIIICPIHGIFTRTPNKHLIGWGCPECKSDTLMKRQLSKQNLQQSYEN